ncbi:MAG: hypothetical protein QOI31_1595 [Solirubrobacterales bacterium]|jgi:hypothetical protein|nr:hypothetical protein [Solirubrobacterales bacterium]
MADLRSPFRLKSEKGKRFSSGYGMAVTSTRLMLMLLAGSAIVSLALSGIADAALVKMHARPGSGKRVQVTDKTVTDNHLKIGVERSSGDIVVNSREPLRATGRCDVVDEARTEVHCPRFPGAEYREDVILRLGLGDDQVHSDIGGLMYLGPGDDRLELGRYTFPEESEFHSSYIVGGQGNDRIDARGSGPHGNENVVPGPGDDKFLLGENNDTFQSDQDADGSDVVRAGPGFDVYAATDSDRSLSIDVPSGTASRDTEVDEISDFEWFVGGHGGDSFLGSPADEIFWGQEGPDSIDAGRGVDELQGGSGDDFLDAADNPGVFEPPREDVDCDEGQDEAIVDAFEFTSDCEEVSTSA